MTAGYLHDIDPAFALVLGVQLYWYGLVYTVGFCGILGWFSLRRHRLGLSQADVVDLTIAIAIGTMVGGRVFDILVYELDYYREHPLHAFTWRRGGMASHGVLIGGTLCAFLFCRAKGTRLAALLDELSVPAAFLLAVGRLGNFIEGGVVGSETSMPWGVIYPDLTGMRHPVALYESAKNLAMVPILILVLRRWPAGSGLAAASFVLLYGALRLAVDMFRDYESYWMGIGTGQIPNLAMALAGLAAFVWFVRAPGSVYRALPPVPRRAGWRRRAVLLVCLLYPLGMPTSWTTPNIEQQRREAQEAQSQPEGRAAAQPKIDQGQ